MTTVTIRVTPGPTTSESPGFTLQLVNKANVSSGVTITDGTNIFVPYGQYSLVFELPDSEEFYFEAPFMCFGSTEAELVQTEHSDAHGTAGTPLTVQSPPVKKITLEDAGSKHNTSWFFGLKINGRWDDPKVYNKGDDPGP